MNFRIRSIVLVAVLVFVSRAATAELGDNQVWSTVTISKRVYERFDVRVGPELQWAENASMHYLTQHEIGVDYNMNNGIRPGIAFKRIIEKEQEGTVIYDVPFFELKLGGTTKWISFDVRNRIELFTAKALDPFYRFRQRVKITTVRGLGTLNVRPFFSEEYFAILNHGEFNKNRINIGAMFNLDFVAKVEIYYLLQTRKTPTNWPSDHVMGANLNLYL